MWRLEPEGEAEKPESHSFVEREAEGVSVNPEGESNHEQTRAKITRREGEDQVKMERKADRNAPGEKGEEIRSPKKKVIRVESEETQDYVRESFELERGWTRRKKFRAKRDQHPAEAHVSGVTIGCSGKALSFWQFASVVIKEGEESYTTNLCQQCYNKILVAQGDKS